MWSGPVKAEVEHDKYWNGPDAWERHVEAREYQAEMKPVRMDEGGGERLVALAPHTCVALARAAAAAETVLGTLRRERLFKLARFLRLIVGTTRERLLVVLSWVLSSVQAIVCAAEVNFRTRLLVKTLTGGAAAA